VAKKFREVRKGMRAERWIRVRQVWVTRDVGDADRMAAGTVAGKDSMYRSP
jgi:hypothetical protein